MSSKPLKAPTKEENPARVQLNIEISRELRKELHRQALEADMPLKDWLPRFLLKHLGPGFLPRA